jgi:hypothetical protein
MRQIDITSWPPTTTTIDDDDEKQIDVSRAMLQDRPMATVLTYPDSRAVSGRSFAARYAMESVMKYPDLPHERAARADAIRHARRLESIARMYPSCTLWERVARAYDDAEGHAGMTRANDMLRARFARFLNDVESLS